MLRLNELKNVGHTMWLPVKEALFCAAYAFRVTWSELSFVLATSAKCTDREGLGGRRRGTRQGKN